MLTFANIRLYFKLKSESVTHSVVSDSLRPHGLPGSSVHVILQARIVAWVAITFPTQGLNARLLNNKMMDCFLEKKIATQT